MTGKKFTLRARAQTVAVREKAGGDVKLKPDTAYHVTKGNSDGSVLAGDIIYVDSKSGDLVANTVGWLSSDELTKEIMDFEAEESKEYEVVRIGRHVFMKKGEKCLKKKKQLLKD